MRVLRVYHGGRDPAHRERDRALVRAGVDVVLVVPGHWPDAGAQHVLSDEPFDIVELAVRRAGDVNRHVYRDDAELRATIERSKADLLDVHEEPFSSSCRQWLRAIRRLPAVGYTAQNVDKRLPPPFAQYEGAAYRGLRGLYPCTRQAAGVVRGKGFTGLVEVLPLGIDPTLFYAGAQRSDDGELLLGMVGRLVPEKGVLDAVEVLAAVAERRPARLVVVGEGPQSSAASARAAELGVADRLELLPWQPVEQLAPLYRRMHVLLVPSRATPTWTEQFGRVVIEAQVSGAVVAAYASGALSEVAGDTSVLVPEGDSAQLAAEVNALLGSPVRYEALQRSGLRRAVELSWDSVALGQTQLYEAALASPSSPQRSRAPGNRQSTRRRAVAEFGPTATLAGGIRRPFALPVLRQNRRWTRALGATIDSLLP